MFFFCNRGTQPRTGVNFSSLWQSSRQTFIMGSLWDANSPLERCVLESLRECGSQKNTREAL